MEWQGRRESENIEDRRGSGGGFGGGFGGPRIPIGLGFGRGGLGIGGIIVLLVVCWIAGINPLSLLDGSYDQGTSTSETAGRTGTPDDRQGKFVAAVLADTEDQWTATFQKMGRTYTKPKLVLFSGSTPSACGFASAATGPFYCPQDKQVYLDLAFFDELQQRFAAPGDFAEAYVIAHEIGHHVQDLLGNLSAGSSAAGANSQSVRTELQADCYAGVWAKGAENERILDVGDIDEALNAASQIGDDRLQKESRGRVVPDSFTHGTAAQRSGWFRRGYQSGSINACDTFGAKQL